ncbi:NuoI/complex I 23 kDa subunit family protein [Streptomyces sp. NPDC056500]|uniref:NuoI/complex I 23 kDa subunit family protein n=1 Tax=Streptomyces sp. NPDC056500 TaxID=3345840 RepID=UPI00368CE27D
MAPIPGSGLAKGLAVTLRTMTKKTVTAQYPEVQPDLPPRTRGVIGLFEENCTVCMLCARECPDWCIYIDSHKETMPATAPGGRERSRNVLDRFAIDFSLCMYCGICIEVCPFDALFWSPEFEYAETDIRELTHERDKLREWMWTVPAPPALDPGAEEPKEIAAARKAAEKLAAAQEAARAEEAQPAPETPQDSAAQPGPGAKGATDGAPATPEAPKKPAPPASPAAGETQDDGPSSPGPLSSGPSSPGPSSGDPASEGPNDHGRPGPATPPEGAGGPR